MRFFKEFNDTYPNHTCTKKLNLWAKNLSAKYDFKIVGFTGDTAHGETILVMVWD